MSIASEITRLQNIKSDIRTALNNKGINASTHNYADFADDIGDIQTGESLNSLDSVAFGNNPVVDEYGKTASEYYEDIADAINLVNSRSNGVSLDTLTVTENGTVNAPSHTAYNEIIVNVQPVEEKDINFYDYDGTLLYSYTLTELQGLTELPTLPPHEGLTAKGWNWTLANLKTENKLTDVGALYGTTDGAHKIYITIENDNQRKLDLYFRLKGTADINWGDGSAIESIAWDMGLTGIPPLLIHEYAQIGNYCISIKVGVGGKISGGYSNHTILKYAYRENLITSTGNDTISANALITRIEGGDDNVEYAWFSAFAFSRNLRSVAVPSKNWFCPDDSRSTGFGECNKLKFITVPSGVKSIYFSNNFSLTRISMPSGITTLPNSAFNYCYSLKRVSLPNSITTVGTGIFNVCANLVTVSMSNQLTTIGSTMFQNCSSLKDISIPSTVTIIKSSGFNGCRSFEQITIPNTVTTLENNAIATCTNLLMIKIPNTITTIGNQVFNQNKNLWYYDFTDWTITNLDNCTFGTNIFQNLLANTQIIFKYKSIADYAATVSNLATYAAYFAYEEDDT